MSAKHPTRHASAHRRPAASAGPPLVVLLNKPYGVLCQFRRAGDRPTLADYITVPELYPAGRLDADSEGLVLLTNDGRLQHRLTDPRHKAEKTYWVQVEGEPGPTALEALRAGVSIRGRRTRPARVRRIDAPAGLWARDPPIRHRERVPTCWLEVKIREGRNRQVRRMTAAVGHPCLRLIRIRIDRFELGDLGPGESRQEILRNR